MKNLLVIGLLSLGLLCSGCSGGKWYQPTDNVTKEWTETQKTQLEKNLDILQEEPQNIDALLEVAFRYQMLGKLKKAVVYYKRMLDYDRNHIVALNNLADIYERVEEYDEAAIYIKRLYEERQDNHKVLADTVRILIKADEAENAEVAVENYSKQVLDESNPDPIEEEFIQSLYTQIYDEVEEKN